LTFHIAIIVVPIFLAGHIALLKSGIGLSWPAISNGLADVLTITAVGTAVLLVLQRATARDSRALSRFSDYALPVLIAVPFISGFLVMHPTWNPFSYDATLFVHVMSANALLVLIPLTKLSHMVLLPATQLVSELAWHFPPDAGKKVGVELGKEGQPI
jgi:nitrate reductase gamma subunit